MASAAQVENSQLDLQIVSEVTSDVLESAFDIAAVFNVPSDFVEETQFDITSISESTAAPMQISQFDTVVVYRGRILDPAIRAWTFTLDAHDFYVLRLGNVETLVYDVATGEWYSWGSGSSPVWRAYTGFNWIGGGKLVSAGSCVVVGDDSTGALFFLDPDYEVDDDPIDSSIVRPFVRQVVAQFTVDSGYSSIPCFGIQVIGSSGQAEQQGDVSLSMSDDRGLSYDAPQPLVVPTGDFLFRLNWQSLGVMQVPGRLFRIEDTGALQRIDGIFIEGMESPE